MKASDSFDGLHEIASSELRFADPFVLGRLSAMGRRQIILTCLGTDCQGAAGRIRIEGGYCAAPTLLRLQPITLDDALRAILSVSAVSGLREAFRSPTNRQPGVQNVNRMAARLGPDTRFGGSLKVPPATHRRVVDDGMPADRGREIPASSLLLRGPSKIRWKWSTSHM